MVAGEVRSLAQRSANAAKEIKGLIGDTVARVDNGTTLVGQAGQTMEEIVQAVKRVTDIMGEISAASAEQSSGIEQVKYGGADGRGDAAERGAGGRGCRRGGSLEDQAGRLGEAVATFRISLQAEARPQRARRAEPALRPASRAGLSRAGGGCAPPRRGVSGRHPGRRQAPAGDNGK